MTTFNLNRMDSDRDEPAYVEDDSAFEESGYAIEDIEGEDEDFADLSDDDGDDF